MPVVPPAPIGISEGYKDRGTLDRKIGALLPTVMQEWRQSMWITDWEFNDVLPEFIMSDKTIGTIAKSHDSLRSVADLAKLDWGFEDTYGASAFAAIDDTRKLVEFEYAEHQRVLDEQKRQKEELNQAKKRKATEEQEERKRQKQEESKRKKRDQAKAKWDAYTEKIQRGENHNGRPPRKPSPSPERE